MKKNVVICFLSVRRHCENKFSYSFVCIADSAIVNKAITATNAYYFIYLPLK